MATAGDIVVNLTANSTQFKAAMSEGQAALRAFSEAAKTAGIAVAAFIGFESVKGAFASLKESLSQISELNRMAKTVGASSEFMSELGFAAKMSHVSIDELSVGLTKFEANLGKAGFKGNIEEAFGDIAEVISKMEDPFQRAALANEAFGRGWRSMMPLLLKGREGIAAFREEAQRFGISFGPETTARAAEFGHAFKQIDASVLGLKTTLATALAPVFTDVIAPAITATVMAFREWIESFGQIESAAGQVSSLALAFADVADAVEVLANLFPSVFTLASKAFDSISGIVKPLADFVSQIDILDSILPAGFLKGGHAEFNFGGGAKQLGLLAEESIGDRIRKNLKWIAGLGKKPEAGGGPAFELPEGMAEAAKPQAHARTTDLDVFSREGFSTFARAASGESVNIAKQALAEHKKANGKLDGVIKAIENIPQPAVGEDV